MIVSSFQCCKNAAISILAHFSHIPKSFSRFLNNGLLTCLAFRGCSPSGCPMYAFIKNGVDVLCLYNLGKRVILKFCNCCLSEEFKMYLCDINSYYPNYQASRDFFQVYCVYSFMCCIFIIVSVFCIELYIFYISS